MGLFTQQNSFILALAPMGAASQRRRQAGGLPMPQNAWQGIAVAYAASCWTAGSKTGGQLV